MAALKKTEFLVTAMRDKTLIRLSRRFETYQVTGYVIAVGKTCLALALVSDRIRFDGFECFRIADIRPPRPEPRAAFIEAALTARGEVYSPCPVDVTSIVTLLTSASAAFPLVAIHAERIDPGVCWIGVAQSVRRGWLTLLEINPDATWDDEPTRHRLRDITRVSFDGDYERALHLVGHTP